MGVGTTFTLWLPGAEPAVSEPAASPARLSGGGQRIMVVDDEASLTVLYELWLERLGYVARTYHGSMEALAALQAAPAEFDLVITDQTMPDMSGMQLAEAIRKIRPDVPVILCTGHCGGFRRWRSNPPKDILRVLQKPMDLDQFSQAVAEALQGAGKGNR